MMCCSLRMALLLLGFVCLITPTYGQALHRGCGRRKIKINYLVRGGAEAKAGHWPWHVAIFHWIEYKCGGSIIDENTILTASHCVYTDRGVIPVTNVTVHAGRNHLKEASNYTQIHSVQKILTHPGYRTESNTNDIALIKLKSKISLNRYVQPVCLWTMNSTQESIVGKNGTIVGFGVNEQDVLSDQLKQALIEVVDPLTCIQKDRAVFGTHLTPDMFCGIGQMGVSACNGDSGGGMFFENRGKWFVRGLVSYAPMRGSSNLCDPRKPTAYTDVAKYLEWIKQYIDQRVLSYESDFFDIDFEEKKGLFNFQNCGIKSSTYSKFKSLWTLPWLGWARTLTDSRYRCTITLISEWYAVGPANCFETIADEFFITVGGYDPETRETCFLRDGVSLCSQLTQTRQIKNVTYPQFHNDNYAQNIALIELVTPADTTQPNVKPICFPVTTQLRTNATENLHVAIHYRRKSVENIPVRHVESEECMKRYAHAKVTLNLEDNQFCAEKVNGSESEKCSSNKPGLPLQHMKLFNETERYFLSGLDLFGLNCRAEQPTVYLNIEPYLDWILYNMRNHTVQTTSTVNLSLESEWNDLLHQPGKGKLRLFNMDACGVAPAVIQPIDHVPWIGFVIVEIESVTKYIFKKWNSAKVVLISEWYALAPKGILQTDKVWRYLILGKSNTQAKDEVMHQYVNIQNIIIPPPDHPRQTFALIELLEPADLKNPYISPICLPFMENLLQANLTELVLSYKEVDNKDVENRNLTVLDRPTCQNRLQWKRVSLLEENSTCANDPDRLRRRYLPAIFGSPFQVHVKFGDHQRYFLYGMNVNEKDKFNIQKHGFYLFDRIESADLEWILEHIQEKKRQKSFLTTARNERVNLRPVQIPESKKSLFDFNTCGISTSEYPTPWVGTVVCRLELSARIEIIFEFAVTLISDWFAVGPADVHETCLQKNKDSRHIAVLGYSCYDDYELANYSYALTVCGSRTQRIDVKEILIHPHFNFTNYANNVALVRLAAPANTSLPFVKPICLPILDAIRSYDVSSLVVAAQTASFFFQVTNKYVDDGYLDSSECHKRWKGLWPHIFIDSTNHCVMNQRTFDERCFKAQYGFSLHSRQRLVSIERNFLRGFATEMKSYCSYYFPAIYTNTDAHLDWILETID